MILTLWANYPSVNASQSIPFAYFCSCIYVCSEIIQNYSENWNQSTQQSLRIGRLSLKLVVSRMFFFKIFFFLFVRSLLSSVFSFCFVCVCFTIHSWRTYLYQKIMQLPQIEASITKATAAKLSCIFTCKRQRKKIFYKSYTF